MSKSGESGSRRTFRVALLWATHEEFMPGRAVRWTAGHVMVALGDVDVPGGAHENYVWLPARDVFRTLPRRPRLGT